MFDSSLCACGTQNEAENIPANPNQEDQLVTMLGQVAADLISAEGSSVVRPAAYKGKIAGYSPKRFEARNSEGNRFIVNSQL